MLPSSYLFALLGASAALAQERNANTLPQSLTYISTFSPSHTNNITGNITLSSASKNSLSTLTLTISLSLPTDPTTYPIHYTLHSTPVHPSGTCPPLSSAHSLAPHYQSIAYSPSQSLTSHTLPDLPITALSGATSSIVLSTASGHILTCANIFQTTPAIFSTIQGTSSRGKIGKKEIRQRRKTKTAAELRKRKSGKTSGRAKGASESSATVGSRETMTRVSNAASSVSFVIALTAMIYIF